MIIPVLTNYVFHSGLNVHTSVQGNCGFFVSLQNDLWETSISNMWKLSDFVLHQPHPSKLICYHYNIYDFSWLTILLSTSMFNNSMESTLIWLLIKSKYYKFLCFNRPLHATEPIWAIQLGFPLGYDLPPPPSLRTSVEIFRFFFQ